jgi:hypothetical protein
MIMPRHGALALCSCCLGCLLAAEGRASELSYTFLDFRYVANEVEASGTQTPVASQTVEAITEDGDGIAVGGSVAIGERFYFVGSYQSSIIDVSGVVTNPLGVTDVRDNFDFVQTGLGFGYQKELLPNFDLNIELSYDSADYDFGSFAGENFDANGSGAGAKIGFRWNPVEPFELSTFARSTPVGKLNMSTSELESDTLVGIGLNWYFIQDLGVGVNYEAGTVDTLTVSMRFSFGRLPF